MAKGKTEIVYDIPAEKVITATASQLEKIHEFEMPQWAMFIKTGAGKERPPAYDGWWYVRAASILRKLYIKNLIGVQRLSGKYSSKRNMGTKKEKVFRSSRKIIRTILQQAEKAGLVEKQLEGKKGRKLTRKGREFLEKIATNLKV